MKSDDGEMSWILFIHRPDHSNSTQYAVNQNLKENNKWDLW